MIIDNDLLHLFAIAGLFLGIVGNALLLIFVLPRQVRELRRGRDFARERKLLPLLVASYILTAVPVLAFSIPQAFQIDPHNLLRNIIRGIFGINIFIAGLTWKLLYNPQSPLPPTKDKKGPS